MKRFNITVNGKAYDVSVQDITDGSAPVAAPAAAPAAPAPAAAPAAPAAASGAAGSIEVKAPMPGTILDVKDKVGDSITKGQVIAVLEAMKMENDIVAPEAGKIASINVNKGDSVNTGDIIATLA